MRIFIKRAWNNITNLSKRAWNKLFRHPFIWVWNKSIEGLRWLEGKFFEISPILIIILIIGIGFSIHKIFDTSKDLEITALMLATYGFAVGAKRLQAMLDQRTDQQFGHAVSWLGNSSHAVQIGALYSLEKIMKMKRYKKDIRNILEEYIKVLRENEREEEKKQREPQVRWIEKRKEVALDILLPEDKNK